MNLNENNLLILYMKDILRYFFIATIDFDLTVNVEVLFLLPSLSVATVACHHELTVDTENRNSQYVHTTCHTVGLSSATLLDKSCFWTHSAQS